MNKENSVIDFYRESKDNFSFYFFKKVDWMIIIAVSFLTVLGLISVYSALSNFNNLFYYFGKQIIAFLFGIILCVMFTGIDYGIYKVYYKYIYYFTLVGLIIVILFGTSYRGTKAWLNLGYFSLQISEIVRYLFILSLAGYLDKNWRELYRWQKLFIPVMMFFGNVFLILLQKDFSAVIPYFPVFISMLFFAGVRLNHILGMLFYGIVSFSIPLLKIVLNLYVNYRFFLNIIEKQFYLLFLSVAVLLCFIWWFLKQIRIFIPLFYFVSIFLIFSAGYATSFLIDSNLKDYQKKRLIVFVNSDIDPLGAGYNLAQSRIAIGSGKIYGRGLLKGKLSQLGYVPERHTDFIFTVIGEEMGFIFTFMVLIMYFIIVWRAIVIAKVARDNYGTLIAGSIGAMFAFYCLVNIGMTMGIMPIVGLPLPFVSYGGSSLISSFIGIGILESIYLRRYLY